MNFRVKSLISAIYNPDHKILTLLKRYKFNWPINCAEELYHKNLVKACDNRKLKQSNNNITSPIGVKTQ